MMEIPLESSEKAIRAVLFDLYDTLVAVSIKDYLKAKAAMARRAGINREDFISSWKKFTKPSALGNILTVEERIGLIGADLGKKISPELAQELSQIEISLQEHRVHKLPGCDFTLNRLKKWGIKIGLVTNTPSTSKNVLSLLGLDAFFDCAIYSFEVGLLKPDVAIYQLALAKLDLRAEGTIFVGDGNDLELDGAKNAGLIAIKVGKGRPDLIQGIQSRAFDYEVEALPELLPIIQRLNSSKGS